MPAAGFDTDRNLLFGVLALQADLLDMTRFAEICTAWSTRKDTPLADLLVERGWLTTEQKAHIDFLLDCKLQKYGDSHASLAAVANDSVRRVLSVLGDADIDRSLAPSTAEAGSILLSTVLYQPDRRERYTLTRLHAQGGLGRVWLARDSDLAREVALKELRPEGAQHPGLWSRFVEEAKITGQLEHPGIVPVYELGRRAEDQQPFYTMRFVRGRTLREAIADYHAKRQKSEATALDFNGLLNAFVSVCQAVAYAHSRGVLHRDLKPQNVVLGDYGEVLVLDWGLAKLMERSDTDADAPPVAIAAEAERDATVQGQVLGTPAYMAPEQAQGRLDLLDRRTDVYGLGAILYEILTGKPPFEGPDTRAVLHAVESQPPERPRQRVAATPEALEAVCLMALAKRPHERYATASEFADEMRRWLADEPVRAYPEPLLQRCARWGRRHRSLVVAAGVLLTTAVVALTISLAAIARARQRTNEANAKLQLEQGKTQAALRAEARRRQEARNALDAMTSEVMDDLLSRQHEITAQQRKFLENTLAHYEEFAKDTGDDPQARLGVATAYRRVGDLRFRLGDYEPALTAYHQATTIFAKLGDDVSIGAEAQSGLAVSHRSIGSLFLTMRRLSEAVKEYREAIAIEQKLVAEHPDVAGYQSALALMHLGLGDAYEDLEDNAAAATEFRRTIVLEQHLADVYPGDAEYQHWLAGGHYDLGNIMRHLRQTKEAEAEYRHAQRIWQRLVQQHADTPAYARFLAGTHNNLGELLVEVHRPREAHTEYRQGLRLFQQLAAEHPSLPEYRKTLAITAGNFARLLAESGQSNEAEKRYDQARTLFRRLADDYPAVPEYQDLLATTSMALGDLYERRHQMEKAKAMYLEALQIWQQLVKARPDAGPYKRSLTKSRDALARLSHK